jgi:hypothetical protein
VGCPVCSLAPSWGDPLEKGRKRMTKLISAAVALAIVLLPLFDIVLPPQAYAADKLMLICSHQYRNGRAAQSAAGIGDAYSEKIIRTAIYPEGRVRAEEDPASGYLRADQIQNYRKAEMRN